MVSNLAAAMIAASSGVLMLPGEGAGWPFLCLACWGLAQSELQSALNRYRIGVREDAHTHAVGWSRRSFVD